MSGNDRIAIAEIIFLENVALLVGGLDTFEKEYFVRLEKGTFKRSGNFKAAHAVLHFLIRLIFPKDSPSLFKPCYPILDKSQERDFRKVIDLKLTQLERTSLIPLGYGRKSVSSSGGGPKFVLLLWSLSNLALRQTLNNHPLQPFPMELGNNDKNEWNDKSQNRIDFLRIQIDARRTQFVRSIQAGQSSCAKGTAFIDELRRSHEEVSSEIASLRSEICEFRDFRSSEGVDSRAICANGKVDEFLKMSCDSQAQLKSLLSRNRDERNTFDARATLREEGTHTARENRSILDLIRLATERLRKAGDLRHKEDAESKQVGDLESMVRTSLKQHLLLLEMLRSQKSKALELGKQKIPEYANSFQDLGRIDTSLFYAPFLNDVFLLPASPKRCSSHSLSTSTVTQNNSDQAENSKASPQLDNLLDSLHSLIVESHGEEPDGPTRVPRKQSGTGRNYQDAETQSAAFDGGLFEKQETAGEFTDDPDQHENMVPSPISVPEKNSPQCEKDLFGSAGSRNSSEESPNKISPSFQSPIDSSTSISNDPSLRSAYRIGATSLEHSGNSQISLSNTPPTRTRKEDPSLACHTTAASSSLFPSPPPPSHRKICVSSVTDSEPMQSEKRTNSSRRDSLFSLFEDDKSEGSLLFEENESSPNEALSPFGKSISFPSKGHKRITVPLEDAPSNNTGANWGSQRKITSGSRIEVEHAQSSRECEQSDFGSEFTTIAGKMRLLKQRLRELDD